MSRFQLIPRRDDVAGNEGVRDALRASSRKRPSTHGINQNSSAKSAKSKTGSTASISDDAPEPAHETPMISFSDVGDKVSNYVHDDFIDEVVTCMYVCCNNRQFCILYYYYYYHHRSRI